LAGATKLKELFSMTSFALALLLVSASLPMKGSRSQ
jgi:hypothetical protein